MVTLSRKPSCTHISCFISYITPHTYYCDALQCVNIVCWFPGVMFDSVSFPLDKVTQFLVDDAAV